MNHLQQTGFGLSGLPWLNNARAPARSRRRTQLEPKAKAAWPYPPPRTPICFREDLRVTLQALGWWPNGTYQRLAGGVASVAHWYQQEPHAAYACIPCTPAALAQLATGDG